MTDQRLGDHPHRDGDARSAGESVAGPRDEDPAPGDPYAGRADDRVPGGDAELLGPGRADGTVTAGGGGGRRRGTRRVPRFGRRGKIAMWVAVCTVIVLVVGAAVVYLKLSANLQSAPLDLGGVQAVEKTDPFGRSPMNILLIGSDSRASRTNCRIGGACGGASHADVEMIIHLSADRSNATVMSIPRDTIVDVPQCTAPSHHTYPAVQNVQINSSLQDGGPGCTVTTVHALTGITIDHFVMIDFIGVVHMADDVGGVPVCVSANVFDPYSHLRLTKGTHVITGLQALEFLRTRHGFLYGGDLYRTQAQHMYLSALIRKMKSASTLANPVTLYRLANDATNALTVDPAIDSIPSLAALARELNKVPAKRITFVTMPTVPYPGNPSAWVSPAVPAAHELFQDIITDTPLTHSDSGSHPTASPVPTPSGAASPVPSAGASASPSASPAGSPRMGPATPPPGSVPEVAAGAGGCAQVNPLYSF